MSISSKENIIFFAQTICDCQYVSPPGSFFHECFCGTRTIVYLCVPLPSSIVTQKNCACTVLEEDHLSQLLKNGPDSRDYLFAIYRVPDRRLPMVFNPESVPRAIWALALIWHAWRWKYNPTSYPGPWWNTLCSMECHHIYHTDRVPPTRAWMHSHSHTSGGVDTKGLPRTNGGPFPPIRHAWYIRPDTGWHGCRNLIPTYLHPFHPAQTMLNHFKEPQSAAIRVQTDPIAWNLRLLCLWIWLKHLNASMRIGSSISYSYEERLCGSSN